MDKSLYEDENLLLIALLREIRLELGLTQSDLAKKLNSYTTFVSKYEVGERRLDIVELRHICAALDQDFLSFVEHYHKECEDLPRSLVRDKKLRSRL